MESDLLTFILKFSYPLMVSIGLTPDMIVAKIVDGSLLSSADSGSEVDPNYRME